LTSWVPSRSLCVIVHPSKPSSSPFSTSLGFAGDELRGAFRHVGAFETICFSCRQPASDDGFKSVLGGVVSLQVRTSYGKSEEPFKLSAEQQSSRAAEQQSSRAAEQQSSGAAGCTLRTSVPTHRSSTILLQRIANGRMIVKVSPTSGACIVTGNRSRRARKSMSCSKLRSSSRERGTKA
jgi:hypothetical protein